MQRALPVNSYSYDAYGNFESRSETVANPYAFTGREYDAESGLFYYRARYYDANTGRFISEDPIGFRSGDANFYSYVFSNPVNYRDPSGLAAGVCEIPTNYNLPQCQPGEPTGGSGGGGVIGIGLGAGAAAGSVCLGPPVLSDTVINENLKGAGVLVNENNEAEDKSNNRETPTRSLDDPDSLKGATPEEVKELIEGSGDFETPVPIKKGEGEKFTKKGTRGSDQILIEEGNPSNPDPLHQGPYVKITKHGNPVRIPLAGNPVLNGGTN